MQIQQDIQDQQQTPGIEEETLNQDLQQMEQDLPIDIDPIADVPE